DLGERHEAPRIEGAEADAGLELAPAGRAAHAARHRRRGRRRGDREAAPGAAPLAHAAAGDAGPRRERHRQGTRARRARGRGRKPALCHTPQPPDVNQRDHQTERERDEDAEEHEPRPRRERQRSQCEPDASQPRQGSIGWPRTSTRRGSLPTASPRGRLRPMQEIFLGARRPPRPGRIFRRIVAALVGAVIPLIIGWVVSRRAPGAWARSGTPGGTTLGTDGNRLTLGSSSLERVGEIWVLRLVGDPYTLGYAQGRLLGRAVGDGGAVLDAAMVGEETSTG